MRRLALPLLLLVPSLVPAAPRRAAALLDQVQERTFRYFWELAHPVSGMAPERSSTPEVVTSGGTGFGIMATLVAVDRGFVGRDQALARLGTITGFLERADRFHGAWPHWLDGATGKTIPFSAWDDGADLVETAFLLQGLLSARQFFAGPAPAEVALRARIDRLYAEVDWTWFTRGGEEVLYWHWSPVHGWAMDQPIRGWNEALVVYVLAAGSPTHPIDPAAYRYGWAAGPSFANGRTYYGLTLPLGPAYGGPLFLAHYSFLGLDPRGLADAYADYGVQNRRHAEINWRHCVADPGGAGYSRACWGLTSSDGPDGYQAHAPGNDRGVIAPTAALASFPYLPRQAWAALVHFMAWDHGRLWGRYGFKDAFSPATGWVADDYLAIDQGPIVVMIENHRTGRPWARFMAAPEVARGLARLGFVSR